MNIHIMTLFPEMVMGGLNTSITGRAISKGILSIEAVNIRDYAFNKHNSVDDYPYGGGAGMLMQAEPVYQCYQAIVDKIHTQSGADSGVCTEKKKPRVLYMSPQGKTFTQGMAEELAQEEELIFLCGHYEGIDERVLQRIVTDYVSIGDYVLTGGELPAMVMMDAIARNVPGVLGNEESAQTESFDDGLLEYPQYTRPEIWEGERVPEVLLSGDHARVEEWRLEKSLAKTKEVRPELYESWAESNQEYFVKKAKKEERLRRKLLKEARKKAAEEHF